MSNFSYFKKHTVIFILFFISIDAFGQSVQYTNVPVRLQLYPRNVQDTGNVIFQGQVTSPGYDSIYTELYKNGSYQTRKSQMLIYNAGVAPFNLSLKIHAECSRYFFKIYVNTSLVKTIDSIVCGDVYLIMGQSNSVEVNSSFTFRNEYCRTFGIHTGNYNGDNYNPADTQWALSTANAGGVEGGTPNVGVWSLQVQKNIKETYNMPTCFINGGRASGFLSIQLRNNSNPEDLTSIYGKLLYRVRKAKVSNNVKAIIFYGGESDGYPPGFMNYLANWNIIHTQWQENYPGFSRIFCLQVRPGCSSGEELDQLREKQRQLGALYNDLELFSTSGISEHFGCHYGLNGYTELATFLMRNIAKKFYGASDSVNILPPNIRQAFFNSSRNKIKILFSGSNVSSWPADTVYGDVTVINHSMKDYFYLDGANGNVTGGTVSGDTLILNLLNPSFAARLSYLPASRDLSDMQVYEGPFIRNPRRLGALSFYDFPITDTIVTFVELFTFYSTIHNRDVRLTWTTSTETNNRGFDIERYEENSTAEWRKIGFVQGNGTTNFPITYDFTDIGLSSGKYHYRLKQIDFNGGEEYFDLRYEVNIGTPRGFELYQNYPNPFNPSTKINYDIPFGSKVNIRIFDISGKQVRSMVDEFQEAGYYTVVLNSSDLPSGAYYYTLTASGGDQKFSFTKKMIVVK